MKLDCREDIIVLLHSRVILAPRGVVGYSVKRSFCKMFHGFEGFVGVRKENRGIRREL